MSGLWFKCQDCGSNVGIVVWSYKWMDGMGLDLCAGLLYEHRFAMLIRGRGIEIKDNKLETFEDALFESSKTSTHKTEKLTH
jgi:hypothetical protein